MLYAFADAQAAPSEAALPASAARTIPLPGLANPESQLGVPLLVRGELVGVLCLESEVPYRFHEEDKASIELLGSYLAIAMQNMQLQERSADAMADAAARRRRPAGEDSRRGPRPRRAATSSTTRADECILLDGEYLIRSLPAKILWRLLNARESDGPRGVHQPRAAAGQVAEPARMEGQPGKPAAAAAPPARAEVSGHPPRAPGPRPVRARARLRRRAGAETLTRAGEAISKSQASSG